MKKNINIKVKAFYQNATFLEVFQSLSRVGEDSNPINTMIFN